MNPSVLSLCFVCAHAMIWILRWWALYLWSLSNKESVNASQFQCLFSLMKHYNRELVFFNYFFCHGCLLYDNLSVCFKSSPFDLLKLLSSFLFCVKLFFFYSETNSKVTLPSYQNSCLTGGDKFFTVEDFTGIKLTFNDIHEILNFTCYSLQVYF